jgi:hypothetical protein
VSRIGNYKTEIVLKELMIKTIIQKLNDIGYLSLVLILLQIAQMILIAYFINKLA